MSTRRTAPRGRRTAATAGVLGAALCLPLADGAAAADRPGPLVQRSTSAADGTGDITRRPQGRAVAAAANTPPQIVYSVSNESARPATAVVRLNPLSGQVRTVVTSRREFLSAAAWSAADARIAYVRNDDGSGRVDSVPQAGGPARLELADAGSFDVSRDGRRVVFERRRNNSSNIVVADRGGRNARQITGAGGFAPRFSPDGSRIVFSRSLRAAARTQVATQSDLFTIRTDGTGLRRVTATGDVTEVLGAFSPDSRRVLFSRAAVEPGDPLFSVFSIGVDGRGLRLVERNAVASDWATNGWITYLSFAGRSQVFSQDQIVVRSPGIPGRESVLTRETSFITAVRFAP